MGSQAVLQGSDKLLLDCGFDNAETLFAKTMYAFRMIRILDDHRLNLTDAAAITGMTHLKVSYVRRYKLENMTLEYLTDALVALEQHAEMVVRPVDPRGTGRSRRRRRLCS